MGESQPADAAEIASAWNLLQELARSLTGRTITIDSPHSARESVSSVLNDLRGFGARISAESSDSPLSNGPLIAIEMALLDVVARALDMSLSEFLGQQRDVVEVTASTLSADNTSDQLRTKVQRRQRFPMIRSKAVADVDKDIELLSMLHDASTEDGSSKPLWMDLDEGFDPTLANAFVDRVAQRMATADAPGLITLEQPLPATQREELRELQKRADAAVARTGSSEIRIMADESLRSTADLEELVGVEGCRAININPARTGGILASLELSRRALELNPTVSIGIGGSIGTSDITTWALFHLARATPSLDYFTAVPPGNVRQRISRPLAKLTPKNRPILAGNLHTGIGTELDFTALAPFVLHQQWFAHSDAAEAPATTSGTASEPSSLGHLAESAYRCVQSRLDFQSAVDEHMDSGRLVHDIGTRRDAIQEIVDTVGPLDIPSKAQRRMGRYGITIGNALSFRAKTAETSEANRLGLPDAAWKLTDRSVAVQFAAHFGLTSAESDGKLRRFSDIKEAYPTVIKSTRSGGSRGCYLAFDRGRIIHTQDRTDLSSWDEMVAHANQLMDPDSPISTVHDEWIVETLVLDDGQPAHEVKFFAFYGDVPLALEVKRDDELVYRFFDPNDNAHIAGTEDFAANGVSGEELDLIKRISLNIPGPFVRINTLRGSDGLILNEFSPRLVGYGEIDDVWDRVLGEAWIRAEHRLRDDLLAAKKFSAFAESENSKTKALSSDVDVHDTPSTVRSEVGAASTGHLESTSQDPPTFADIREALGGEWYGPYERNTQITDATFRLRRVGQGSAVFLTDDAWGAKRQKRSGQFRFTPAQAAERAAAKGAVLAISSTKLESSPIPVLVVKNSRRAMFKLAQWIRTRYQLPVVGITGTVGKSTTTSLLSSLLSHDRKVHHTPDNWNTVDGVSDTLFGLISEPDVAVVEAALSGFVVVPQFSSEKLLQPTITVITAIGEAHRNMAPTVRDTALIKGKLVSGIRPGGSVVLNADTPYLDLLIDLAKGAGAERILTFGRSDGADLQLINWGFTAAGMSVRASVFGEQLDYEMSSAGEGLAMNSLSSFAAAILLGMSNDEILAGISAYTPIDHVSNLHEIDLPGGGKCTVIDDSTNATIMSMKAAFELLEQVKKSRGGRTVAALGQVNYLGEAAEELHATLADPLKDSGVEYVITTGTGMNSLREELGEQIRGPHAESPEHMVALIRDALRPGDILLLKGSNMGTGFRDVATSLLSGE